MTIRPHHNIHRLNATPDFTPVEIAYKASFPIAYWPLNELTGSVANDISGNGFHGTYNNVSLNATTFPDGSPAPLFDASNERVSLPVAGLDTPFDPANFTMACWLRVRAASVWSDGVSRIPFSVGADASNRNFGNKPTVVDRFDASHRAGAGAAKAAIVTSYSPVTWFHFAITVNTTADEVRIYNDGVENVTSPLTGLDTWAGALVDGFTAIGNFTGAGGGNFWDGYIKHCAIWDRALAPQEVASLVPAAFLA